MPFEAEAPFEAAVPPSLFHYTTEAGLLGIVESRQLWATDIRFLNDAQEGIYGYELIADAVREMESPTLNPTHWAHQHGERAVGTFNKYRDMVLEQLNDGGFGVFVTCFCESGDLLSQWRAYGADHGYAIEFRAEPLLAAMSQVATYVGASGLARVRYGADDAADVIERAVQAVGRFNLNHPGVKAWHKALELTALLATIKHPSFQEEREWRLFGGLAMPRAMYPAEGAGPLRFRAARLAVAPYVEVSLSLESIQSIRIGPGANAAAREAGIRTLLAANGCTAEVVRSDSPLRG